MRTLLLACLVMLTPACIQDAAPPPTLAEACAAGEPQFCTASVCASFGPGDLPSGCAADGASEVSYGEDLGPTDTNIVDTETAEGSGDADVLADSDSGSEPDSEVSDEVDVDGNDAKTDSELQDAEIEVPPDCTDLDGPCTVGTWDGEECVPNPLADVPCDDGDPCTADDSCTSAGTCIGQTATCDDANPCTEDFCDAGTCSHNSTAGSPCQDGVGFGVCGAGDVCITVQQLAAGGSHTCALLSDGSVRCWGNAADGRLGYPAASNIGDEPGEMPPEMVDLGGSAIAIAAGTDHTCAIMAEGQAVRCWGLGTSGQLGYESTASVGDDAGDMPPPNVLLPLGAVTIAAGMLHTCAVFSDHTTRCWGKNSSGQLGTETSGHGSAEGTMPPPTLNLADDVVEIDAGVFHTCVKTSQNNVKCFGEGALIGYESKSDLGEVPGSMPPPNVNVGSKVTDIALGNEHSCALLVDGSVRCWGNGDLGQLGTESMSATGADPGTMPPEDVVLGSGSAASIAAGAGHTCAILKDQTLRCWGYGTSGQLGTGLPESLGGTVGSMPPPPVALAGEPFAVTAGTEHTCVLLQDRRVQCFGKGDAGQLGYASPENVGASVDMPPPIVNVFGANGSQCFNDSMCASLNCSNNSCQP